MRLTGAIVALLALTMAPAFAAPAITLDQATKNHLEGRWVLTASPKLKPRCNEPWIGGTGEGDGAEFIFAFKGNRARVNFADSVDYDVPADVLRIARQNGALTFHARFIGASAVSLITVTPISKDRLMLEPSTGEPHYGGGTLLRCGKVPRGFRF